ncbi:MAG: hypothetical protein R3Y28_03220 [Candidatus Gastranaerophilales bacterium]
MATSGIDSIQPNYIFKVDPVVMEYNQRQQATNNQQSSNFNYNNYNIFAQQTGYNLNRPNVQDNGINATKLDFLA